MKRALVIDSIRKSLTKTIDLDDDLQSVHRMISYMYTFDYDDYDSLTDESVAEKDDKSDVMLSPEVDDIDFELFSSVRVYAIAEKYEIPGLKELARSKFAKWTKGNWNSLHCSAMAAEAFTTTSMEDTGPRDIVADIVVQNISLVSKAEWQEVIAKNDYLSRKLLCQLTTTLTKTKRMSEDTIKNKESQIQNLENQKSSLATQLSFLVQKLNSTTSCRHCDIQFNVSVETPYATVRCRDCRTRHY